MTLEINRYQQQPTEIEWLNTSDDVESKVPLAAVIVLYPTRQNVEEELNKRVQVNF
jgi:hypothetical protein